MFFLVLWGFVLAGGRACANPQGMTVTSGSAHATQQGNVLQITTSHSAALQWTSFNIAAGEMTVFQQPSAASIVFNNIGGANASTIYGSLQANGIVVLQNRNGFYFGPNAFVKAGGLVVTTAAINPWASAGGAGWSFDGPPPATPVVNYGHLETASGGSLFLIAKEIDNHGTIEAPGGAVALVAGQEVLLSTGPDGLSLSAPVRLPAGSVNNEGRIVADAGQVLLQAQTVNNSGAIQANSVREKNGVIELFASQDIQLAGTSVIQANGNGDGTSPGGNIVIKSGGAFGDSAGSQITATGGANGGNGGKVEVSAPSILSLNSSIDASAQPGWSEGTFALDPENIVLGTAGSFSPPPAGTVDMDVNSAFQNITAGILLEASGNITLNTGTAWNLSASTGKTTGQLTLEAGVNITLAAPSSGLENGAKITDANDWSVTLEAGNNVTLYNNSAIETAAGNITILAGNNVTVRSGGIVTGIANGSVMTGMGGDINVQAGGNVNCGSSSSGYLYTATGVGYEVDPNLGGISTASGGSVTIQAGGNISAALPTGSDSSQSDYGSGAFGAAPGNVTLTAGGDVIGHYVLANGKGTITAANAGNDNEDIALSLIKGGWVVNAADSISLQEVRNPNGMFNDSTLQGGSLAPTYLLFNYDPLASVVLNAGQGVTITGNAVPRVSNINLGEGLIFPPSLTINAGSSGITLETTVNLFPSPEGTLNLTTTGGGNLSSLGGAAICLSDSQHANWQNPTSFTYVDSGNDALHLGDPNPVLINISGSVSDLFLYSPKPVEMYVARDMIDSSVIIKNLRPTDNTIISAGGQILDHSQWVILTLPSGETPDFTSLDELADPFLNAVTLQPVASSIGGILTLPNPNFNPTLNGVQGLFSYDPVSRILLYSGTMNSTVENALLAMKTPFLNAATIEQVYAQSQLEASTSLSPYKILGPGTFTMEASSIDLGNSGGVVSAGIDGYPGLVPYTARGADIDISVSGDLSMLSSTIESEYGGNINVRCGGTIDVGSGLVPSFSATQPLGIVSLWEGNINVIAQGNVNVDGARIAAYDGGNVFVKSLEGNVNAGAGGKGYVLVTKPYVNALGKVADLYEVIPGSGILATSFPQLVYGETSSQVGNITVETPRGDIVASRGGIVQLALGSGAANGGTITLTAGSKNSDGTVAFVGNVDASGSGVVGGQVNISATGNINGLVVASVGANVSALQNVSATVLSQGAATVSAGGTVSGTIVGVGSVSVSGATDVAVAFSSSGGVTTSGAVSGAAVAAAPTGSNSGAAAATTQQVTSSTQPNAELASNGNADDNDPLKKKKKSQLMEYVGRVTVLLPQ